MDDKKIYKQLQDWFPELNCKKVPKESQRRDFQSFKAWMVTEKNGRQARSYLMPLHPAQPLRHSLGHSAVLQDMRLDLEKAHLEMEQAAQPTLRNYEQHKAEIGKNYSVQEQVAEIVLSEICSLLRQCGCRMLLIYADQYYWIAVPEHAEKVNKFCKKFEKQFKADEVRIELFSVSDCLKST